ncbi:MAG: beta-ketoacyl synthase N-terminal-like domain-containing protein [Acidobacteriota bacterium]|nr:beta-ketoacyl synthase N-terminal-like domain-containing protein [Acidobacteriota bacterium]
MSEEYKNDGVEEIAVIGMAARVPGAKDVRQFWENLSQGVESITFFDDAELSHIAPEVLENPNYVKANGVLGDIDQFDASFFDLTPMEAKLMDPQQRLFLECCWHALENAGYNPETHGNAVGLFGGTGNNSYVHHLLADPHLLDNVGQMQLAIGNGNDHFTPRVSYLLNLRGPSVPVQTACSTSLVAVHVAVQSLMNYECDMALAGGCSLSIPENSGYTYVEDSILSPDGHCRPFDADAKGTVRGSGVGVVMLKRLEDALNDGDHIHAIVKGSAINNDGSVKIGYTAPSVEGQRRVVQEALAVADIEPETISYIETHGTATSLGDPIEIEALNQAFGDVGDKQFCALGSVKSNVGHLDSAAGVAGFIKAVLCLENRKLVPSLHYKAPNPQIDFDSSPFYVNTELRDWTSDDSPRRAGVSSFGIGGTNAHVILEEVNEEDLTERSGESRDQQVLTLSAATADALENRRADLKTWLQDNPDAGLADIAFTLNVGRKGLACRQSFVAAGIEQLNEALDRTGHTVLPKDRSSEAVFAFPGQGTDYPDFGAELYEKEEVFRDAVNRCCKILEPEINRNLADLMFSAPDSAERDQLREPAYWQPALFVVGYASARLWMSWGIRPRAMTGHSIGEYVAAVLAGVLSLEDGLKLIATRGRLTGDVPRGAMTAVIRPEEDLAEFITEPISLAAKNGPSLCILSGPTDAVEELEARLKEKKYRTIRLGSTHAFHSSMIEPIMEPLTKLASGFNLSAPKIPYISNVTGTWMSEQDATDPAYWARHLRGTVRFSEGLETLFAQEGRIFIEAGPGKVMTNLVKNHAENNKRFPSIGHSSDDYGVAQVMDALGRAWCNGVGPDWGAFYGDEQRCRLALPTYPFEHKSYWVEGQGMSSRKAQIDPLENKLPKSEWFYVPSWRKTPYTGPNLTESLKEDANWLFYLDAGGEAEALATRLEGLGQTVVRVTNGETYEQTDDNNFMINPAKADGVGNVIKALIADDRAPTQVVFAHSLNPEIPGTQDYDNLVRLAQALAIVTTPFLLTVLTRGVQQVTENDLIRPERAPIVGATRVIPKEVASATCKAVDLPADKLTDKQMDRLLAEMSAKWTDDEVVLRGRARYVEGYDKLPAQTGPVPRNFTGPGKILLINGLQEIGFALAEYITGNEAEVEVVLLDRAFFPPENDWDDYLRDQGEDDPVSRKIVRYRNMNRTHVKVATVNPSNGSAMRRFKDENGPFRAIFFLDPLTDAGLIQTKYPESPSQLLATRLVELRTLESITGDEEAVIIFTENQGESGLGFIEQAACFHFTYRFVNEMVFKKNLPYTCIDWGTRGWDDLVYDEDTADPVQKNLLQKRRLYGMTPDECIETMERLLPWEEPRTLISTREYDPVLEQLRMFTAAYFQEQLHKMGGSEVRQERPDLSTEYKEPTTETEKFLVEQWEYFFGVDQIGIDDNFFELGGHSLLAVQMLSKVTEHMGVEVPVQELFERPSIAELGVYLDEQLRGGVEDDEMAALLAEIEGLSEDEALSLLEEES